MENKPHIKLDRFSEQNSFKYSGPTFSSKKDKQARNRNLHGQSLMNQIIAVREYFDLPPDQEIDSTLVRDDVVYIQFTSAWGYELAFDMFDKDRDGYITGKELAKVMKFLYQEANESDIREMISNIDRDIHEFRYSICLESNYYGRSWLSNHSEL